MCYNYSLSQHSVRNTDAQKQTGNAAVSVNIPVRQRNTAELCISLPRIIQGCLTYRQGTARIQRKNFRGTLQ